MTYPNEPFYYFWFCKIIDDKEHRLVLIHHHCNKIVPMEQINSLLKGGEQRSISSYIENEKFPDMWDYYYCKHSCNTKFKKILITPKLDLFNPNVKVYCYVDEKLILRNPEDSSWRCT